jgi:[ribosomal protein S18]-alanine N-acetyltransferase
LNVRLATPADIPAIRVLEKQANTAAHWSDEIYHSLFAAGGVKRIMLVADQNGCVSAFIVTRVVGDDWEIENVIVATHLRRRGIASALIHDLVQRACADSARQILLEVRQSNASARDFYIKAGFVESGRRRRYYQDPEDDAVCYRLDVSLRTSKSPGK